MAHLPDDLKSYYSLLQVTAEATIQEVDQAYFELKSQKIRQGRRQEIPDLKVAWTVLKDYLEQHPPETPRPDPDEVVAQPLDPLLQYLRQQGLEAQVRIRHHRLHIGLQADQVVNPKQTVAQIYTELERLDLGHGLEEVETVIVYGLTGPKQASWKESFPMPSQVLSPEDTDLLSFQNRFSNAITFPLVMGLAMFLNAIPLFNALLFGVDVWIHEFGHATVAWLAGRRALPLPFGWTNVEPQRSLFVYFGVLILLGLLFWAGRREQRRWPMGLAITLGLLQFVMTWMISANTFDMLLSFGGIGGEFYLSTLLMASFYFPLPDYFRWEFYRYPVVLGAAFTFWGSFWSWRQIDRGLESIPWGSLWGGADHAGGDMNQLSLNHGWSDQQIIDTYNTVSGWCLFLLLGLYFHFLLSQNRALLFALKQRFLARS